MAIKTITNSKQWDSFVDNSPYGLIFHKWDFLKLAEKYTGYQFLPYGVFKGDRLICVFPLFYKKILGVKLLFSPPPQSGIPYLGPVFDNSYDILKQDKKESYLDHIVEEMDAEIKKIAPHYTSVLLLPEFSDIRPFLWRNYGAYPRYTYTIDLAPELSDIWDGLTPNCRQNIRKGEKLKCLMKKCDDTSVLTDLLSERYNEQGLNFSINSDYLKEAMALYPESLILNGLYDEDTLVGVTLNQVYKKYIGWMGLPKPKTNKYTYTNECLIWKLIEQAKTMGLSKFEISGANKQNLCRYRAKFNPKLEMYFIIVKKDLLGRIAEAFYLNFIKKM